MKMNILEESICLHHQSGIVDHAGKKNNARYSEPAFNISQINIFLLP
jgi:hypothetical protein